MLAYYFVTTFNAINQCIGHYGNMGYQALGAQADLNKK